MVRTIHNGIELMQIKYRVTAADFAEASAKAVRPLQIFGGLILVAGVLVVVTNPHGVTESPIPIALALVFGLFLIFGWRIPVSRAYRADRRLQQEWSATIGEEGIELQGEAAKAEYSWRAFVRFVETKNLFVLYHSPRLYNAFPKRSFAPGEADAFRALAQQKVIPVPQKQPNVIKTIVFWLVIALSAVLLWQVVRATR